MAAAGSPATASTAAGPAAAAGAFRHHHQQQQQQQLGPIAMNISETEWALLLQRVPAPAPQHLQQQQQQQQPQHLNRQQQQQLQAAYQAGYQAAAPAVAGPGPVAAVAPAAAVPAPAAFRAQAARAAVEPLSIAGASSCEDVAAFIRASVSRLMQLTVRLLPRANGSCVVEDLTTWLAHVRQVHAADAAVNNAQLSVGQHCSLQLLRELMVHFMRNMNGAAAVLAECGAVQGLAGQVIAALVALGETLHFAAHAGVLAGDAPRNISSDMVAVWLAALQQQAELGWHAADGRALQLCSALVRGFVG
jgi:hypothetical protein